MENDITFLGKIIRVDSNTVEVEVNNQIPSSSPIISGKVYKIGQIGTFVKVIAGNIISYGIVAAVSNTPSAEKEDMIGCNKYGSRFLIVNLIGEKIGNSHFEKGIGIYPTINDEVHIVTEDDLRDIYRTIGDGYIEIGQHAASENLSVSLNLHNLVLRHTAVVGSTGSGKSNSVVTVVKKVMNYANSRMIIIDPHGEYASAFPDARIFKIGDNQTPLYIPFWLMNFDELAYFLVGAKSNDDVRPEYRRFREIITQAKKDNMDLKAGAINNDYITADSPIPFDIRKIWYDMNWELNSSYSESSMEKQTKQTACLVKEGDAATLTPAEFEPYSIGSVKPYKSKRQEMYAYEKKLLSRLKDSRYDFLFNPGEYKNSTSGKDLHDLLQDWIGSKERLSILDLSNVPFEVLDITVGLITRFIYDSMVWGRSESYTGRSRPLFVAYDEAHSYLGKNSSTRYARDAVERIFKEGRKFGIGAMVISQRPSELSETILAQVGTFIALRLTNSTDQNIVKSLAPDNMNSLINLLPSLKTGEAIIVGEAISIPSRVRLPLQYPRPDSCDPKLLEAWDKPFNENYGDYKSVVTKLREQQM